MNKKLIIGLVIAVVVIAVIGIAIAASNNSSDNPKPQPEPVPPGPEPSDAAILYYGHVGTTFVKFTGIDGYEYTANDGCKFASIRVTEKNNNYKSYIGNGYYPTLSDFQLKCSDGIIYSSDIVCSKYYSKDSYNISSITLPTGESVSFDIIFEIPVEITGNVTILWAKSYVSAEYDSSLPL